MVNNQQGTKVVSEENQNQDQQLLKKPKSIKKTLIILAVIILTPVAYWKIKYPSYTYRYKMTVEVETPEGVKSGSSVVEVHTSQMPESWAGISGGYFSWMDIKGEGVFIDIEKGKTLFFLLGNSQKYLNANKIMRYTFPMPNDPCLNSKNKEECMFNTLKSRESMSYYGTLKNAKSILPEDQSLLMVSAVENDNKLEFKIVKPEQLKEAFGVDVKVKQITIETTNDKIEWKIRKLPIWSEIIKYGDDKAMNNIYLDFVTSI